MTHRNQIIHKGIAFTSDCMIKKIANMNITLHSTEKYRKKQKYNVYIKASCNSLKLDFFVINIDLLFCHIFCLLM